MEIGAKTGAAGIERKRTGSIQLDQPLLQSLNRIAPAAKRWGLPSTPFRSVPSSLIDLSFYSKLLIVLLNEN